MRGFWEEFSPRSTAPRTSRSAVLDALDDGSRPAFLPRGRQRPRPAPVPGLRRRPAALKLGRFGAFIGCSNYPECRYTRALGIEAPRPRAKPAPPIPCSAPTPRPASGHRQGPLRPLRPARRGGERREAETGGAAARHEAGRFDLEPRCGLLSLPRDDRPRIPRPASRSPPASAGSAPYIKHGSAYVSLAADDDVLTIGLNRAVDAAGRGQDRCAAWAAASARNRAASRGRYGRSLPRPLRPYVSHEGVHASLPKGVDPDNFALEAAIELLATQRAKGRAKGKPAAKPRRPARKTASAKAASAQAAVPAKPAAAAARNPPSRAAAPKRTTKAKNSGQESGETASAIRRWRVVGSHNLRPSRRPPKGGPIEGGAHRRGRPQSCAGRAAYRCLG